MSAITIGGDIVHYEVLGRGRPVVLVHGWMGSWRYWIPIMQQLHLKYRVYALDLFGYGDSAKNPARYTIEEQVNLMSEFMSQLGLSKAALIGHGLGAQVIAEFANQNREMVPRLLIASAPLFDTGDLTTRGKNVLLNPQGFDAKKAILAETTAASAQSSIQQRLEERSLGGARGATDPTIARRPEAPFPEDATIPNARLLDRAKLEAAALARAEAEIMARRQNIEAAFTPPPMSAGENPLFGKIGKINSEALLIKCFKKTEPEYSKLNQDVAKQDSVVVNKITHTFDPGKMLDILRALPMPVVVVHGMDDPVIDAPSENIWTYITNDKEDLLPVPLPGVRHFPMLEAETFTRLVNDFLEAPDISKLEVKERWRRRSR